MRSAGYVLWKWAGVAALAGLAVLVMLVSGAVGSALDKARRQGAPKPVATRPASMPASAPTTRPATQPAKPWKPPRFKARQEERDWMVAQIRRYGLTDPAILKAMASVPRHEFVPERRQRQAYIDSPLPIGFGQTISQPYIVAEMTRQLRLTSASRVLEIGTGSGYQAAVLTDFTPHVYTIEIVKPLADSAAKRLKRLGYSVVKLHTGDGYYGWPKQRWQSDPKSKTETQPQFDAIIVTCAAGQIPPPLIRQLKTGGRMIIPVGGVFATQSLMLLEKDKTGQVKSRNLMPVRFVPLVRKAKSP